MNKMFMFFVGFFFILGCAVQASSFPYRMNKENELPAGILPSKRGIPYRQNNSEQLGLSEAWKADMKRDCVTYAVYLAYNPHSASAYLEQRYQYKLDQLMKRYGKPDTGQNVDFWIREECSKQATLFAFQQLLQKYRWEHPRASDSNTATSIW